MPHRRVPPRAATARLAALVAFVVPAALAQARGNQDSPRRLPIGAPVASLQWADLDGAVHELAEIEKQIVVFAWSSTTCPLSKVYLPRLEKVQGAFAARPVSFWFVDPGSAERDPDAVRDRERRAATIDDQDGALARAVGATRTTTVVVLDELRRIAYRGAVDDQYGFRPAGGGSFRKRKPSHNYLEEALLALLDHKPVSMAETEAFGCALFLGQEPAVDARAADGTRPPTFHRDVQPLLQKHCQECHHRGGTSPFALESYTEARLMAAMIGEVVESRRMPPWNVDPAYGEFVNARVLTAEEIAVFRRWVAAGRPRGDPADAPAPRHWKDQWRIGKPDLVLETPEFVVPAEGTLPYRYVRVETGLAEDRWVQAAQIRSTRSESIHHVLIFVEESPEQRSAQRPWRPPFNPLTLLQGAKPTEIRSWVARFRKYIAKDLRVGTAGGLDGYFLATNPGEEPVVLPRGQGKFLPAGATLVFQIHYTPTGIEHPTTTSLGLRFTSERPAEVLDTRGLATVAFAIPPGVSDQAVEASFELPRAARLVSLRPHMHLRGKSFRYIARYPDGREETLLHVPRFDFYWQYVYALREPLELPKGTVLRGVATFDNSTENPDNPAPERTVYFGLQSDEEMMIGYYEVVWAPEER